MLNVGNTKEYKTYTEQVQLLRERGLRIDDEATAVEFLKRVNYYRFSAYTLTLQKHDRFYNDVSFEDVCDLYYFDCDFRKTIYAYTAFIEVALRTCVAHFHAGKYGALGYLDASTFDNPLYHARFLTKLDDELSRSDDAFVHHHVEDLNSVFPLWVAIEATSFGVSSMMFKNMHTEDREDIAKRCFRYNRKYIENWLQCCVYVRNIAAHGGRFYNRDLRSCPVRLPSKHKKDIIPTRAFAFIYAIYNLLPFDTVQEQLVSEIRTIFTAHPFALLRHVGFPDDWERLLLR
ncbi:MAG: Abi family protein [Clostridiales Family XIII bacterium]|jgi:abortive infection bacteriophage resistance protein|nr:Abi family protein [Clostridiales Family XIII bacterium]